MPVQGGRRDGIIAKAAITVADGSYTITSAKDGIHGVHLANAMHLSSWLGEAVTLPINDELFYEELKKRIAISKPHEVHEKTEIQG